MLEQSTVAIHEETLETLLREGKISAAHNGHASKLVQCLNDNGIVPLGSTQFDRDNNTLYILLIRFHLFCEIGDTVTAITYLTDATRGVTSTWRFEAHEYADIISVISRCYSRNGIHQ